MTYWSQTYKNLINLPCLKRSIAIVFWPEDKNDLYVVTFNLKPASETVIMDSLSCLDLLLLVSLCQEQKQDPLLTHAWPYFLSEHPPDHRICSIKKKKKKSFWHIKNLLYYFTTLFYNILFIRYFII